MGDGVLDTGDGVPDESESKNMSFASSTKLSGILKLVFLRSFLCFVPKKPRMHLLCFIHSSGLPPTTFEHSLANSRNVLFSTDTLING